MGNGISQKQNKGVLESQSLTNILARFMCNTQGANTCKYLVNWRNYTKRDLNLKWTNWGSFDIIKLIFLHAQLEKACFDQYLEASETGNDRVTSSQKINKKLLETIRIKKTASADFARSQVQWNWEVMFGIYAIWLLILVHHFTIFWGHSCHSAFDFWASLCLLFHLECDSWLVKFWFHLACWFDLSAQTSWYKLLS